MNNNENTNGQYGINQNVTNNSTQNESAPKKRKSKAGTLIFLALLIMALSYLLYYRINDTTLNGNDSKTSNNVEKNENNSTESLSIVDEYFDVTNPIPILNRRSKYGYIDNKGTQIIEFKYDLAFDFNGDYALVKDESGYYFIDRKGSKVKDVPTMEGIVNPEYDIVRYARYGVYQFDSNCYDLNLNIMDNCDITKYDNAYNEASIGNFNSSDYNALLEKYNYKIDGFKVYNNAEEIFELDNKENMQIEVLDYQRLNYLIKNKNILPIVVSYSTDGEVIDLISKTKLDTGNINALDTAHFELNGLFASYSVTMAAGFTGIYSFFSNKTLTGTDNDGVVNYQKTYIVVEDGGSIGKETTNYTYYNSDLEKIYVSRYYVNR